MFFVDYDATRSVRDATVVAPYSRAGNNGGSGIVSSGTTNTNPTIPFGCDYATRARSLWSAGSGG